MKLVCYCKTKPTVYPTAGRLTLTSAPSWAMPVERLSFLPLLLSLTPRRFSPSSSSSFTGSVSEAHGQETLMKEVCHVSGCHRGDAKGGKYKRQTVSEAASVRIDQKNCSHSCITLFGLSFTLSWGPRAASFVSMKLWVVFDFVQSSSSRLTLKTGPMWLLCDPSKHGAIKYIRQGNVQFPIKREGGAWELCPFQHVHNSQQCEHMGATRPDKPHLMFHTQQQSPSEGMWQNLISFLNCPEEHSTQSTHLVFIWSACATVNSGLL